MEHLLVSWCASSLRNTLFNAAFSNVLNIISREEQKVKVLCFYMLLTERTRNKSVVKHYSSSRIYLVLSSISQKTTFLEILNHLFKKRSLPVVGSWGAAPVFGMLATFSELSPYV